MPNLEAIVEQTGRFGPMLLIAIAVFLILEVLFLSVVRRSRSSRGINQRLTIKARVGDPADALRELRRTRGLDETAFTDKRFGKLKRIIAQSGIGAGVRRLVVIGVVVAVVLAALIAAISGREVLAVVVGILVGVGLIAAIITFKRQRRMARFIDQLPEAIDVMVRSLKAGHPVPVAIGMVASEMSDPAGSDFGLVADEMTYGLDLEGALASLRDRTGLAELSFLVVAVSIQSKAGGNLAEVLSKLSRMIRERARLRRKIKSLSSEGRWSAWLLSILPAVLFLIFYLSSPGFYGDVKDDPVFMPVVVVGLLLWLTGAYVIRRMVNFKV